MSNIKEIIKLLDEHTIINTYITYLVGCKKGVQTRHQSSLNTVACRLWQLQYCILTIIFSIDPNAIVSSIYLDKLCRPYYNIFTSPASSLFLFITQNTLSPPLECFFYINAKIEFQQHITSNVNTYLCIYGIYKRKKTITIYPNGIVHYFTIIRDESDYYITSSYGSDNVSAPYCKKKLENIAEFYMFCEYLQILDGSQDEYLSIFMRKYFLANAIPKRFFFEEKDVAEYKKLYSEWIPENVGEEKEIKYILNNTEMIFDVAIIKNYEELVNKELFASPLISSIPRVAGIIDTRVNYKKKKPQKSKKSKKRNRKKVKKVKKETITKTKKIK